MSSRDDGRLWRALNLCVHTVLIGWCLCGQHLLYAQQPAGVAVVMNANIGQEVKLPEIADLRGNPQSVADRLRAAGWYVSSDPTDRCLAVTRNTVVSDDEMRSEKCPDRELTIGIFERLTQEQLDARAMGYITLEKLTPVQQAAVFSIAKRRQLVNRNGTLPPGKHLAIGVWPTWMIQAVTQQHGIGTVEKLRVGAPPPTPAAIIKPPLLGSTQWWLWPQADAQWGSETVSIPAGQYTLKDLVARVAPVCKGKVLADPPIEDTVVLVVADGISIRQLLWAVSVVTGLQVKALPMDPYQVLLTTRTPPGEYYNPHQDEQTPISPADLFYSPASSKLGSGLLSLIEGGVNQADRYWIGWRYHELPLLYRNRITAIRQRDDQDLMEIPSPLDPDHTIIIWTKAVTVSIDLQARDGSGQGIEFSLPAF